jgi:hypothetical protein
MIAVFEGMLDPRDRKVVIAEGPFTVEVFENPDRPKYWRARMLPGRQEFFERKNGINGFRMVPVERSTAVEVRLSMEFRFKKRLKDWHEPHGESAALVDSAGS